MRGIGGVFVAALCIWLAAIFQQAFGRCGILGASPDFILVAMSCLCLFTGRAGGAVIGFFAGLAAGGISGANLSQYIVTRTLSGFLDSWSRNLGLDANAVVAAFNAFAVTIVAQLGLMFLAPPPGIAAFLGATIGTAMFNGVLAVPVHALLTRILGPQGS